MDHVDMQDPIDVAMALSALEIEMHSLEKDGDYTMAQLSRRACGDGVVERQECLLRNRGDVCAPSWHEAVCWCRDGASISAPTPLRG